MIRYYASTSTYGAYVMSRNLKATHKITIILIQQCTTYVGVLDTGKGVETRLN
jgi:hypothetical protein